MPLNLQQAPIPLPQAGVHVEKDPAALSPYELADAFNWIYRDGVMRVRDGVATVGTAQAGRPNGFIGFVDGATGNPYLLMATTSDIFRFDDASQDWSAGLSASLTADATHHTIFRAFELGSASGPTTTIYMCNGKDTNKKWAPGGALAAQGGNVPISRAMMVLNDRMLVGNLQDRTGYTGEWGPAVVATSDPLDPDNGWNTAQITQLLDTQGAIVAMQEMGNLQGAIYKTDAIYMATAEGTTAPFAFDLKRAGIAGPLSPRSVVAAADGLHYFIANDGAVYVFDGIEPKSLGRHVQRYVLNTWDSNVAYKAHGVYDNENREVVFFYPGLEASEPGRAIRISIETGAMWPMTWSTLRFTAAVKTFLPGGTTLGQVGATTIGSLNLTLGEYQALGQAFLYGEFGGRAHREHGNDDAGNTIPFSLLTGYTDLGAPLLFKSLRYIDHEFQRASDAQEVDVTVFRTNYGEDAEYDIARSLDVSEGGPYRTFHRFPARRYGMKLSGEGTQEVEWQGSTAVYANQGGR